MRRKDINMTNKKIQINFVKMEKLFGRKHEK